MDRFLEHLMTSGEKLRLAAEGGRLSALVAGVDDEFVHLEENRLGVTALDLDDIDGLELASLVRDRRYAFDGGWLRAYPNVLHSDKKWRKLLKAEGEEADLLRQHAVTDYPRWARLGGAASALEAMSASYLPAPTSMSVLSGPKRTMSLPATVLLSAAQRPVRH